MYSRRVGYWIFVASRSRTKFANFNLHFDQQQLIYPTFSLSRVPMCSSTSFAKVLLNRKFYDTIFILDFKIFSHHRV